MIEMQHKKSKGNVNVHPTKVEEMKNKGWTEVKDSSKKKAVDSPKESDK